MRELSLFSGAGGGLLGTKLLGWRAVGYVERDGYCQAVLAARIRDGFLDPAPIFGDVRQFLSGGWAGRYRGLVDVVTAGFPCQPFSVAGKRLAHADERNLWPETARVLDVVRPRYALLENVPGLVAHEYFGTVLGDLAALGFSAEWGVFGADDVGAPHRRKRLWILAYTDETGRAQRRRAFTASSKLGAVEPGGEVADANRGGQLRGRLEERGGVEGAPGSELDGCDSRGRGDGAGRGGQEAEGLADPSREQSYRAGEARTGGRREHSDSGSWWDRDPADEGPESESFVGRVAHGVGNRVDRLRALGNGQVPAVVVRAWQELYERTRKEQ